MRELALALIGVLLACVAVARATTTSVAPFDRVVVVVFENKDYGQVIGSRNAPAFNALTRTGALLANYDAVAHPSLPNYLALVSGSTQGITSDCTSCVVRAPSLADQLESSGRTWKTYAEGLPRADFAGPYVGRYAKKHNPFSYFQAISGSRARMARIVPLTRFARDRARGALPDFSLVVPDLCHDMHDCPVAVGDRWLRAFLRPLLASPSMGHGVVFVIFDEGTSGAGGGGHVAAFALGPLVRPGARMSAPTSHYGLLRTIEDSWGLPHLGQAASGTPITGIWRSLPSG